MGADLLSGVAENSPDERKAIVIGILLLVRADLGKIVIGRHSGVGIGPGPTRGNGREHRLVRPEEQQSDGRPGARDAPLGKEVEQSRYDVTHAADVGAVIGDRALVANAP